MRGRAARGRSWSSRRRASSARGSTRRRPSPPGSPCGPITESRARRGVPLTEVARGRRRRGHLLHALPPRGGRLRRARLGRARARRGADGQEPHREDPPERAPARRAVPAGAHRHPDGEPAHGAVVAALDRGARALPLPAAVHRGGGQPRRAGGRRRGPGTVPTPDPAVPAAPHQGAGRLRPAAQAGAGPRGAAHAEAPEDLRDPPPARAAERPRPARRLRQAADGDLPLADPAASAESRRRPRRQRVRRRRLRQGGRARRPPARGRRRGPPRPGVQPVHVVPHPGPAAARRRGDRVALPRRPDPAAGRGGRCLQERVRGRSS